ncbi:hypothetical protein QFC20_004079 [Naganishia adeliensis]|uniref:Uncharacterized protein n=1 Tax=Naganishia adeliensis TaxID=92952 RepID=A0ACC2W6U9_9TREE|nr:hypothetical protein QFC20_004079 [Naganishia adeliensis]
MANIKPAHIQFGGTGKTLEVERSIATTPADIQDPAGPSKAILDQDDTRNHLTRLPSENVSHSGCVLDPNLDPEE